MNFQYPFFADSGFKIHIKNETKFVIDGENPILSKTKKPKEELVCIFLEKAKIWLEALLFRKNLDFLSKNLRKQRRNRYENSSQISM